MSEKYDAYLKTDYWKAVSDSVKRRAGYRCQVCNSQHDLQAHHRTYDHKGSELEHLDDLVCMCRRCHAVFHGKEDRSALSPEKALKLAKFKERKKSKFVRVVPHESVDLDMPEGDPIILSPSLINQCRANSSFTNATVRAFGLTRATMTSGWVVRLCNTPISREKYREALEGRFIYNSGKLDPC